MYKFFFFCIRGTSNQTVEPARSLASLEFFKRVEYSRGLGEGNLIYNGKENFLSRMKILFMNCKLKTYAQCLYILSQRRDFGIQVF